MIIAEFKVIPDTDGNYSCDRYGHIRSNSRTVYNQNGPYTIPSRILKPYINNKGYEIVSLRIGNKTHDWLVHRLIAKTWIPNPNDYPIINHKDNDPLNNSVDNLEWCSYSYNNQYAYDQGKIHYTSKKDTIEDYHKPFLNVSIEQYDSNGDLMNCFNSAKEAGEYLVTLGTHKNYLSARSCIISCCRGRMQKAGGFMWKYKQQSTSND